MMVLLYVVMLVLLFVIALMLQRLFNGPTIFDRMNALGVIGADTICLIVVFGFIDKRPDMYVDIAISYALLGFLGSLIVAKFIGGNKIGVNSALPLLGKWQRRFSSSAGLSFSSARASGCSDFRISTAASMHPATARRWAAC